MPTCKKQNHKTRQYETADGVTKVSEIPQRKSTQENKSSGGNSTAEIHSKNLCLSNCFPRDVVINATYHLEILQLLSKFNSKRIVPSATVMWSNSAL